MLRLMSASMLAARFSSIWRASCFLAAAHVEHDVGADRGKADHGRDRGGDQQLRRQPPGPAPACHVFAPSRTASFAPKPPECARKCCGGLKWRQRCGNGLTLGCRQIGGFCAETTGIRRERLRPLRDYLKKQKLPEFVLTFEQIEEIIDAALPRAAHRASWWETCAARRRRCRSAKPASRPATSRPGRPTARA